MKKFLAIALAALTLTAFASCANTEPEVNETDVNEPDVNEPDVNEPEVVAMTYEEYAAAAIDDEVVVDAYVQGKQAWWDNKATVYTQDEDGAYFLYEMACSEEDYAKLVPGTHILVKGVKAEWSGEVEIVDATFEIIEGEYIAEAFDATELLGTDELINHQNKLASFKELTVEKIEYKNGEPGDDIYLTLSLGENSYDFCVEIYLTGEDSEVYKTVGELNVGDKVDVEGFIYWYENVNPHVTAITVIEAVVE